MRLGPDESKCSSGSGFVLWDASVLTENVSRPAREVQQKIAGNVPDTHKSIAGVNSQVS